MIIIEQFSFDHWYYYHSNFNTNKKQNEYILTVNKMIYNAEKNKLHGRSILSKMIGLIEISESRATRF